MYVYVSLTYSYVCMYICTYFRVVLYNFNLGVCPHYSMYCTNVCTLSCEALLSIKCTCLYVFGAAVNVIIQRISPPSFPQSVLVLVKTHSNQSQGTRRVLDYITDFNYINQLPFYCKALSESHEFIHYMQKFTV